MVEALARAIHRLGDAHSRASDAVFPTTNMFIVSKPNKESLALTHERFSADLYIRPKMLCFFSGAFTTYLEANIVRRLVRKLTPSATILSDQ